MAASPWEYFTRDELACSHCGEMHMDGAFMRKLVSMRKALAFPFPVTSGYRCPAHNAAVSGTGATGVHTLGIAVDIRVSGAKAHWIVTNAAKYGFTGIGVKQSGPHGSRFIHLDMASPDQAPRPTIWSYK